MTPDEQAFARLAASCAEVIPVVVKQVEETRATIEEAVVAIGASFRLIAQRARDGVSATRTAIGDEGGHGGIHSAIQSARATLEKLLDRILSSSQLSMKAIHKMSVVEKEMKKITKILDDVDQIAQDARMLSVNARIEAVRLGEMGRGFAVVASEINQLAKHSEKTSTSIRGVVDSVERNVVSAFEELKQVSSNDMNEAILSKGDVDQTLDLLANTVDQMRASVLGAAGTSEALANDVNQAIVSLQFQDATSQRLEHVVHALARLQQCSTAADGGAAERLLDEYTMQSERDAHSAVAGETVAKGSVENVELFLSPTQATGFEVRTWAGLH